MNFKALVKSLLNKLIIGMILSATLVIALIYFLHLFHVYITEFSNGASIETTIYAAMFIVGIVGIYFLQVEPPQLKKSQPQASPFSHQVDIETLGLTFLEGFLDGMGKKSVT